MQRRTLVRTRGLPAFRQTLVDLALHGSPLDARSRVVVVPTAITRPPLARASRIAVAVAPGSSKRSACSRPLSMASTSSGQSVFDTNDRFDAECRWATPASGWQTQTCSFHSGAFSDVTLRLFANGSFSGDAFYDNVVLTAQGSSTVAIIILRCRALIC